MAGVERTLARLIQFNTFLPTNCWKVKAHSDCKLQLEKKGTLIIKLLKK